MDVPFLDGVDEGDEVPLRRPEVELFVGRDHGPQAELLGARCRFGVTDPDGRDVESGHVPSGACEMKRVAPHAHADVEGAARPEVARRVYEELVR